ncbi:hypothetical protein [Bacillus atrophaeus]|uniref:cell division protein ZapB n=1 Tax=Bacillus atrophaeus TaxID=1452 RepID=UPI002E24549C|nr:hypothetical protein [Bacillus atrophaeus]MED1030157.1 hypothetical protein [Bacillus atrophaeus]MED1118631.1 hypothetical protein [Bacillus atrophaeus]MED1132763.1 hypothetical protein [Bacillus atrophaeus]
MANMLAVFGFLALLVSLGYGLFHLVRILSKKEKTFSKTFFWPLFIGGLALLIAGASFMEPVSNTAKADDDKYSALQTSYKKLSKEHDTLEKESETISANAEKDLNASTEKLKKENKELKKKQETLQAENKELKKKQTSLNEDKKRLRTENKKLQTGKEKLEQELKEAKTATASSEEHSSNTVPSSGSTNKSSSEPTAETNKTCDIKGSKSGIYHTPGSTYYDRTTDPAEMFCSVEDAKAAGYRAPKR